MTSLQGYLSSAMPSLGVAGIGVGLVIVGLVMAAKLTARTLTRTMAQGAERIRRGAIIEPHRQSHKRRRRLAHRVPPATAPLTLGGVPIAAGEECKHFKLLGTTGTGKSTAIRELLSGALLRGDRAVIADPDGGYLARFYDRYRGDIVLNPFEQRSVKWDLFAEIRNPYDVEQLANGLIPSSGDSSAQEWRGYARTYLAAVTRRCYELGRRDSGELWRLLTTAPSRELRSMVAGSAAQPFLDADNARMFSSIRSVLGSAVASLQCVHSQRAATFSVRQWVRGGSGVLFIPYNAGQIAALRSIIATWMRLAIDEAMSGPEADQRLWFAIDELDALGAIDGLKDALARLRKFGGRCVLGFQSIAQVSSTYGSGDAQTIVENCGNTLVLRCSGSENGGTSKFASGLIGEREIVRQQTSRGRDREGGLSFRSARRSSSVVAQHVTEPAVLPSEIEQLPDLCGFLKTAASPLWYRVAF